MESSTSSATSYVPPRTNESGESRTTATSARSYLTHRSFTCNFQERFSSSSSEDDEWAIDESAKPFEGPEPVGGLSRIKKYRLTNRVTRLTKRLVLLEEGGPRGSMEEIKALAKDLLHISRSSRTGCGVVVASFLKSEKTVMSVLSTTFALADHQTAPGTTLQATATSAALIRLITADLNIFEYRLSRFLNQKYYGAAGVRFMARIHGGRLVGRTGLPSWDPLMSFIRHILTNHGPKDPEWIHGVSLLEFVMKNIGGSPMSLETRADYQYALESVTSHLANKDGSAFEDRSRWIPCLQLLQAMRTARGKPDWEPMFATLEVAADAVVWHVLRNQQELEHVHFMAAASVAGVLSAIGKVDAMLSEEAVETVVEFARDIALGPSYLRERIKSRVTQWHYDGIPDLYPERDAHTILETFLTSPQVSRTLQQTFRITVALPEVGFVEAIHDFIKAAKQNVTHVFLARGAMAFLLHAASLPLPEEDDRWYREVCRGKERAIWCLVRLLQNRRLVRSRELGMLLSPETKKILDEAAVDELAPLALSHSATFARGLIT